MINIVCLLCVLHCVIYLGMGTGHPLVEDLATSRGELAEGWGVTVDLAAARLPEPEVYCGRHIYK